MHSRTVDISGKRFGRLTVVRLTDERRNHHCVWECICDCGSMAMVSGSSLRSGVTKSCGCLSLEVKVARFTKHGMEGTRTYRSWVAMRARCNNPKTRDYASYGGRGITVCERWESFENFLEDMGERPPGKSLDRINNDLGYLPDNCRWATAKEQANNRRAPSKT